MKEFPASDAKSNFNRLLEAAAQAPVRVTQKGRPVCVMMSVQQYNRIRGAAWERLSTTMDRLGSEAAEQGLTDAELDKLLADES